MPAGIDQAAADEHRRRNLIDLRELADGVEHDDVGARLGVDRQIGSPDGDERLIARQLRDFGEPLGMARRDDEQRVGTCWP